MKPNSENNERRISKNYKINNRDNSNQIFFYFVLSSSNVSQEDQQKLEELRIKYQDCKKSGCPDELDLFQEYHDFAVELLIDLSGIPDHNQNPDNKPDPGYVKPGGWGANPNPFTWKVVPMKDHPEMFKVVDGDGKNVATGFLTEAGALKYINDAQQMGQCPVGQHFDPIAGGCVADSKPPTPDGKDMYGLMMVYPTKSGTNIETDFKMTEKTRNYQSGKASENSTEYTSVTPDILQDTEATTYLKINGFKKEADTVSVKHGGPPHKDGACCWVIFTFMTDGSGKATLETESPHPSYHQINPKPVTAISGSLIGQWIGLKTISYRVKDSNKRKVESWIHYPVSNIDNVTAEQDKWRQYVNHEIDDKKYYQATGKLTTYRIDGTTKGSLPSYKYTSVREIQVE